MGQVMSSRTTIQTLVCLIPESMHVPLPGIASQGSSGRKADIHGSNFLKSLAWIPALLMSLNLETIFT